ncbi:hypothetical protein V6N11_017601 [Hibiscus sabdariffa]|uniref:Uncharacterized protein n=1 Tax=Hibiscus sabdariffa TaxID=183260 RepID=A0ABR2TZ77_9ROSI
MPFPIPFSFLYSHSANQNRYFLANVAPITKSSNLVEGFLERKPFFGSYWIDFDVNQSPFEVVLLEMFTTTEFNVMDRELMTEVAAIQATQEAIHMIMGLSNPSKLARALENARGPIRLHMERWTLPWNIYIIPQSRELIP